MACHFARYVERVASAGKAAYPIPMFVNAALNRPGRAPGEYPSGGPLPHLFEVWRAGAPSIDFLSPDIYFPNFVDWCRAYSRPRHPLFIPEIANGMSAASEVFCAIGQYDAMGFSPFAIDTIAEQPAAALKESYELLHGLAPLLLEAQGSGRMAGAVLDSDTPAVQMGLGDAAVSIRHDYTFEWSGPAREITPWPRSGALIIATGPRDYIVVGNGIIVTFATEQQNPFGLLKVDEGRFVAERFVAGRRLNGDETHQGRHVRIPYGKRGVQRVQLYRY
jgi:beta-galactosidase GanA